MRRTRATLAALAVLAPAGTACTRTAPPCIPAMLEGPTVAALHDTGRTLTYSGRGVWHLDGTPIAYAPAGEDATVPACLPADVVAELGR